MKYSKGTKGSNGKPIPAKKFGAMRRGAVLSPAIPKKPAIKGQK